MSTSRSLISGHALDLVVVLVHASVPRFCPVCCYHVGQPASVTPWYYSDVKWQPRQLNWLAYRLFVHQFTYRLTSKETLKLHITGDRWIPLTKGQWCRKCFHFKTSPWLDSSHTVGTHCEPSHDWLIRCHCELKTWGLYTVRTHREPRHELTNPMPLWTADRRIASLSPSLFSGKHTFNQALVGADLRHYQALR